METPEQCVKSAQSLTIKTTERRQWRRSGFFSVNFEQILQFSGVSIVYLEQVITG